MLKSLCRYNSICNFGTVFICPMLGFANGIPELYTINLSKKIIKIMKKLTLMLAVFVALSACKQTPKVSSTTDVKNYVDSVNAVTPEYTVAYWTSIDEGYKERAYRAKADSANLNDEQRRELEESEVKYNELKAKYEAEIQKNNENNPEVKRAKVRTTLFGEGKVGTDMGFTWVDKNNILNVYTNFVDAVKANQETFSREDWDEVKVLYEALDTRKNVVEKEGIATEDNLKIAKKKIEFSAINAMERPMTKVEENMDAKK